jgi:hypothetical protein
LLIGEWGFVGGVTLVMLPGFVATLVHRRREVRRVIGYVEARAPAMTTPELSALVKKLEAQWEDPLSNDMRPLRQLVERREQAEHNAREPLLPAEGSSPPPL